MSVLLLLLFVLFLPLVAAACCWLFLQCAVFPAVRVALLPRLRFTVVYGVVFVAPASCSFAAAFAAFAVLLLLLLWVLSGRRPLKANLCPLLTFQNVFYMQNKLLFVLLCWSCSVQFVLLFVQFAAACAACCLCFFLFLLHSFAFSVVCPPFAAAFGSPTVEKPPLLLLTFQNVKNPYAILKVNNQLFKNSQVSSKNLEKPQCCRTSTLFHCAKTDVAWRWSQKD